MTRPYAIIVPARRGSTRFYNKPLAQLHGRSMIARTWEIACAAPGVARVVVATDCEVIAGHITALGGEAIVDDTPCDSGSARVARAAEALDSSIEVVVNLQGDAPLTPPDVVAQVAATLSAQDVDNDCCIATAACPLDGDARATLEARKAAGQASGTSVVVDRRGFALYFSRAVLPYERTAPAAGPRALRHIGIYGFARKRIAELMALPVTPLEKAEGLEQLRWLEHGYKIAVATVELQGRTLWSVDHPADLVVASEILQREGEIAQNWQKS